MMKKYVPLLIKPLLIITSVIIFCTLLSRVMLGGDTLLDYAEQNPEIALASPSPSEVPDGDENDSLLDSSGDTDGLDVSGGDLEIDEVSGQSLVSAWSVSENKVEFRPGFSKEPISDELFEYMKGISFPITLEEALLILYGEFYFEYEVDEFAEDELDELYALLPNIVEHASEIAISRDDLAFLSLLYYDYEGNVQVGELICNVLIADDLLWIFYELFLHEYQLARIRLIDEFGGSDTFSMLSNNSHSFNYRESSPGRLSLHAFGLAVDVNPIENPYVAYNYSGTIRKISPAGSEDFADRSLDFPHKIDEDDLLFKLFDERGFFWGGNWNFQKDYHHFQMDLR